MFDFTLTHSCPHSRARLGRFSTPHGVIQTPVFMPVGTKAVVKTLTPADLKNLDTEIILANAYHLAMRPGADFVARRGGLHHWIKWDRPILTDSGGFQVFSLNHLRQVTDEGVEFQSHIDGSKHFFTPEKVVAIQNQLGADIIMAFDECAPADVDKTYAKKAMQRTHDWAIRCQKSHTNSKQALFPIIQGVIYDDLRIESAKFMAELDLPGVAIGGLSVGENMEQRHHILEVVEPHLPKNKPRYLMGIGTPRDIVAAVARGVDMFDCVLPTRLARHGAFWNSDGRQNINNQKFKEPDKPLAEKCLCSTCQQFATSYLRHLYIENEITGHRLLTIHNLHYLLDLVRRIRQAIRDGNFNQFMKNFPS